MATAYVDQITGNGETVAYKAPCRVATTSNIVLSGLLTVDGVAVAADDRVLVKSQTDARYNGIYIASTGLWQRARDMDSNRDLVKGTRVAINDGSTLAGSEFRVTTQNPIHVGVSEIAFGRADLVGQAEDVLEQVQEVADEVRAIFLGTYASDGDAETAHPGREVGSRYFNTVEERDRVWTGSMWTYAGNGDMVGSANLSDVSNPTLAAGNLKLIERDTVALLLADTILAYAPATGKTVVATGQIVKAGGFRYKVAASGASDHQVVTAGSVKLYVLTNADGRFNVLAFGAAWDGTTDDAAILQKAIDTGPTLLPFGSVKVASSIILPNKANIIGMGQLNTNIVSGVIGASTFKTTGSSVAYVYLAGFSMTGNGLTGASGNGHAINFIDPAIDSGTHTPQQCLIERVSISGFKGNDVRDNGALTIEACAYIGVDGVHNTCRKVYVGDCGHGFYFYRSQNCRVEDCVVDGAVKSALIVLDCENVICTMGDFVNCSDGVASTNYPLPALGAVVSSYNNEGFVLENTKVKTPNGGPLVGIKASHGDVLSGNWLRAENLLDAVGRGVYVENASGTRILANTFSPTGGAFGRKAQNIEIYTTQTNMGVATTIEGNTFLDISGGTIEWNIKLTGNAQTRTHNAVSIQNNNFGDSGPVGSAATVEADILIASCTVRDSIIAYNKHSAITNVTRTAGVKIGASVTLSNNTIGPNSFLANGGTITANYDGITETILPGSATYDPPNLAASTAATTTLTVTGAALGDFVEASFSQSLNGVVLVPWVSAADTVSVRFQNLSTASAVDLASGTLRVRVRKA